MIKPSFSQTSTNIADQAQLQFQQALDTVHHLEQGETVAQDMLNQATETLLETLESGQDTRANEAERGLLEIYTTSADIESQSEIIGKLVAVGEKAQPVLEQIIHSESPAPITDVISPTELKSLIDSVSNSPHERLLTIVEKLPSPPPSPSPEQLGADNPMREQEFNTEPESESPKIDTLMDPPKNKSLDDMKSIFDLADSTISPEIRLNAALEKGEPAISELISMLPSENPDNREFAFVALSYLGQNPNTDREVYFQTQQLESDPKLRPLAEALQNNIMGTSSESNNDSQHGVKNLDIGDGWLNSALESCDSSNILKAATGREILAMPLALKHLVAKRRVKQT